MVANGRSIPNGGQLMMEAYTAERKKFRLGIQATHVHTVMLSVEQQIETGRTLLFDKIGVKIRGSPGHAIPFVREG